VLNPRLGSYTYEVWVKRAAGIAAAEFILNKSALTSTGGEIFMSAGSPFTSRITGIFVNSAAGFADGAWHHVVIVMNRLTNIGQFYVDGVASGAPVDIAGAAVTDLNTADPQLIGKRAAGDFFAGSIDEVAIYLSVLTAQQIAQHYALRLAAAGPAAAPDGYQLATTADPLALGPYDTGPLKLSNFEAVGVGSTLHLLAIPF
jgi:hypothetical protein